MGYAGRVESGYSRNASFLSAASKKNARARNSVSAGQRSLSTSREAMQNSRIASPFHAWEEDQEDEEERVPTSSSPGRL